MLYKTKVKDSDVSPYIKQRKVVLCRSGIQYYHRSELESFMTEDNRPPVLKEWYKEYRPANVVVRAKDLCASLPATKEHPEVWVNPKNWKELAGGTTDKEVTVVALDGESEGEIGLQSVITFYDESLHDYYEHNKEVSLGYTCRKHWVDNPEELGYDIILDEILEVNHIAITRAGRGGSSVAVIDSIIGGLKPMRTGIFSWLARNKQSDSKFSFGSNVLSALEKGKTESSLANEIESVLDSCSILKEGGAKDTLINAVKDCFDHKDKALDFKEALIEQLDTLYSKAQADSIADFDKTLDGCHSKDEEKTEDSEEKEDKKDEKSDVKDSLTVDKVAKLVKDSLSTELKPLILETVKECLGIKDSKDEVKGIVIDSKSTGLDVDYSSFLDC